MLDLMVASTPSKICTLISFPALPYAECEMPQKWGFQQDNDSKP